MNNKIFLNRSNREKMNQSNNKINMSSGFNDKSQNKTLPGTPLQKELHEELSKLESNFAKMEAQYMKIIKQMKNSLCQRSKKNVFLNNEMLNLKSEFKEHEQEIKLLIKEVQAQEEEYIRKSNPKINTSPGIIQKSIDSVRRTQKNLLYKPLLKNVVKIESSANINSTIGNIQSKKLIHNKKAYSPPYANKKNNISIVPQKFKRQKQIKQTQVQRYEQEELHVQKQLKIQKIQKAIKVKSSEKKVTESQGLSIKSKKDLNLFLCASLKNVTNKQLKPAGANSPKRVLKKSPDNASSIPNVKKETKAKLGNIKEELVQIF